MLQRTWYPMIHRKNPKGWLSLPFSKRQEERMRWKDITKTKT
jgi:hypothetical protein